MSAFDILKQNCQEKPFANFDQLAPGEYLISKFELVVKQFKDDKEPKQRLLLDLGEKLILLPDRYSVNLTESSVDELNRQKLLLVYHGKNPHQRNKIKIDFKSADELMLGLSKDAFSREYI